LDNFFLNDVYHSDACKRVNLILLEIASNNDVVEKIVVSANNKYLLTVDVFDRYLEWGGGALFIV